MKLLKVYHWIDLPRFLGLTFSYVLLASMVLSFSSAEGNITIFWIPGGLGLGALLIWGERFALAIFVGALLAGLLVGDSIILSTFIALGNTLESLCAYYLLCSRSSFNNKFIQIDDFLTLAWIAAASALISALIGPLSLWYSGILSSENFIINSFHWWQADFIGILLGTPLLLVWQVWPSHGFSRRKLLPSIMFFCATFMVGQIIFLDWFNAIFSNYALGYWEFLFVVSAAILYGRHGTLLVITMIATQALLGAVNHVGYFAEDIAKTNLENFWFYQLIL